MTRWNALAFLLLLGSCSLIATLPVPRAHGRQPQNSSRRPIANDLLRLPVELSELVRIGESDFLMGSTADEVILAHTDCVLEPVTQFCHPDQFNDERPTRLVHLSTYWMQRYEVSLRDYERCVAVGRCQPAPYFRGAERFYRPDYPAVLVTWQDARDYCAFWGGRLPTEAEFERAARGLERRTYPWGNLYNPRVSNHGKLAMDQTSGVDGARELAPVGSYPNGATPDGIHDLAGNAEEWVWDRYAVEYDPHDTMNPRGPSTSAASNQRVVRGGSYLSPRPELRGAWRDGELPTRRHPGRGFRCVRSNDL